MSFDRFNPDDLDDLLDDMLGDESELMDDIEEQRSATARSEDARAVSLSIYLRDPIGFIERFFPTFEMTDYDREILGGLVEREGRSAAKGPRGLGKTALSAVAVIWLAICYEAVRADWKIVTTAGSWLQLSAYLWPEIHKWVRELDWAALGEYGVTRWVEERHLLKTGISLQYGKATSASPERAELIEGAHASATGDRIGAVFVVFDESKSIPRATFDAIEGVFSNVDQATTYGFALAVSTPGSPAGAFYDIHQGAPGTQVWKKTSVSLGQAIAAGRVTRKWADNLAELWGEDSPFYKNHVLGDFAADDRESLIQASWVQAAVDRWHRRQEEGFVPPPQVELGVDVARHGRDRTVLAIRRGHDFIEEVRRLPRQDTAQTTVDIALFLREVLPGGQAAGGQITVDADGMGVGVADALKRQGFNVRPFFGAPKVDEWRDRSGMLAANNRRSAAWFHLAEMLNPRFNPTLCLPPDDELIGDLTAPRLKTRTTSGSGSDLSTIELEKKDDTKKRIGRSPDVGDALVYCLWAEKVPAEWIPSADWTAGANQRGWGERPSAPTARSGDLIETYRG